MRALFAVLALLAFPAFAGPAPDRPDPALTPGAIDPAITQANIDATICVPGYTATVRPPASYTTKLKLQQLAASGFDDLNPRDFEEDHLISLEIGGSPTDPKNLWPEHWAEPRGAHDKDRLENRLHALVCSGRLPLADAQHAIASDWEAAYRTYVASAP